MENFKHKALLLATSGILALTSLAHAADDEQQLREALAASRLTFEEERTRQATLDDSAQNVKLCEVVKYMLARPGEIRSKATDLIWNIEIIVDPRNMGWNQIAQLPNPENPLGLDEVKRNAQESFEAFCLKQNVNPVVMEPLFAYLWDRHIQENPWLKAFTATYSDIVTKMKANEAAINAILEPISQTGNPSEEEIGQLSNLMARLGIQSRYEDLQRQRDAVITNLLQPLEDIRKTPGCFIKQAQQNGAPHLDHLNPLVLFEEARLQEISERKKEKEEDVRKTPERFIGQAQREGAALNLLNPLVAEERLPEIREGKKEKEEAPVIQQKPARPPLRPEITNFQKKIRDLIEEAGKIKFSKETVRELGRTRVGPNHQALRTHINSLFDLLSAPKAPCVDSKPSFFDLYAPIKDLLGRATTNEISQIYDEMHYLRNDDQATRERLNGTSSFEYLGQVFNQVARTYALLQQHNPNMANEYLTSVFYTFQTQMEETSGGTKYVACQLGMTVRLFQIHALTLDTLVAHYTA